MLPPMDFCLSSPRTDGIYIAYPGWWSLVLQTGLAHTELEIANLAAGCPTTSPTTWPTVWSRQPSARRPIAAARAEGKQRPLTW